MEKLFSILKKYYLNIWIRNGILYIVFAFFNLLGNAIDTTQKPDNPFAILLILFIVQSIVFIYNHFFIRLFLLNKKYLLFLLGSLIYVVVFGFLLIIGFPYILGDTTDRLDIPNATVSIIVNTLIALIMYFLHYNFLKYIQLKDIEALNIQNEMDYLKQQLNPHFLLNALNNLYSVSLVNPRDVSNKIIELSDLLKYQIEINKKDYNYLYDEKKFIEKYIEYSKWKLQNITIKTTETGTIKNYRVTPMLFLPLVENAIKYSNFERNPIIHINWIFSESKFIFSISNDFKENKNENFSTQTGLKNLKKRLQLFHPESSLDVSELDTNFTVNLTLWNLNTLV